LLPVLIVFRSARTALSTFTPTFAAFTPAIALAAGGAQGFVIETFAEVAEARAAGGMSGEWPPWLAERYVNYIESPDWRGRVATRALVDIVLEEAGAWARGTALDARRARLGLCRLQMLPSPRDPARRGEPRASYERFVQTGEGWQDIEAKLRVEAAMLRAASAEAVRMMSRGRKPRCVHCSQEGAAGCANQCCSRCCGGECVRHGTAEAPRREELEPQPCTLCGTRFAANSCPHHRCARCCTYHGGCQRHKRHS
jgi:hypothetical protein